MGDRSINGPSPPPAAICRELLERGAFASLKGRLAGCGALELKVAEACSHYFRERRGEVALRNEMRALRDLAEANRSTARQVRRDHPRVAAKLQQFAEVAEGAITRAGRPGGAASQESEQLDNLIAGLFIIAWHTTKLTREQIFSGFIPPILQAVSQAYPGELPAGDRINPGARFRRHLAGTLRWINTRLRKRPDPYTPPDLIRHWEHLAFTDDERFPADLAGHRERGRPRRKKRRARGGAAGRN